MLRKGSTLLLAALLSLLTGATGWAAAHEPAVHIIADGYYLGFDVSPRIEAGRVLVPWRWLAAFYGLDTEYAAERQQITTRGKGRTLVLTVGATQAEVDGRPVTLDVAPTIVEDRLLVPLRFAAEALGLGVAWDESSRTVRLTGGKAPPAPLPSLRASDILNARRAVSYNIETGARGESLTRENPAEAAVLDRLAEAWQRAIPAVHPAMRPSIPGAGFEQVELSLVGGREIIEIAWQCKASGCGPNAEGYVVIMTENPILVYAPELYEDIRLFPMTKLVP